MYVYRFDHILHPIIQNTATRTFEVTNEYWFCLSTSHEVYVQVHCPNISIFCSEFHRICAYIGNTCLCCYWTIDICLRRLHKSQRASSYCWPQIHHRKMIACDCVGAVADAVRAVLFAYIWSKHLV